MTTAMAGEFIKSRKWAVDRHDWEIHLRPKDHCARRHGPVTLKIVLLSEPPRGGDVKAKLGCRLVDQGQAGAVRGDDRGAQVPPLDGLLRPCRAHGERGAGGVWLPRGRLIHRAVHHRRSQGSAAAGRDGGRRSPPDAAVPSPDLHRHLLELLREGTGADVTFLVSGKSFAAHKAVLASRSPVFKAELFGEMKEGSSRRVEVKDMEPAVFKALLHFIYTDTTVPELDRLGEEATSMAQHLLAGADRYGLDRLKLICEWKLSDCITVDTAATTLALAEQHHCSQLKARCVEFIAGYLDAVLETEGYKHLEATCPSVLTDLLKAARI
ncbi:BTB/POZ and MATH domain-containing protein 1 [Dichanthelium oligosanthes]|uniref:BTB/POZ and MATH domain-containing protein 1 n=1 Tax=Dichanthelium oligosanthes TaxID=888268 RepID=A0A1E5USS7_9POAL|nr:BTB/POZ and MATH domain-containing protein 1 [Dichanthelium oligosanthes]